MHLLLYIILSPFIRHFHQRHWRRLVKNIGGVTTKILGEGVAITDEIIGFLKYWGHVPGCPQSLCKVLFSRKKVNKHIRGLGTHYHIRIAYLCKIRIKYTTGSNQSLGNKKKAPSTPMVIE